MSLNIRLYHLKQIGKRKKEELQNEQGRNGNVVEGNRTGDDRPGQAEISGRIQENIKTDRITEKEGEHLMEELMTLKEISKITGKKYKTLYYFAWEHKIKPVQKEKVAGKCPAGMYDPTPFFEKYGKLALTKADEEVYHQQEESEVIQKAFEDLENQAEEFPSMAPPLPTLTPELIYALRDVIGGEFTRNVLRNNYGLNYEE